jgi:predicted kinase
MSRLAEQHLRGGRSVVLDATFRHAADRRAAVALAKGHPSAQAWIVECRLPEAEVRRRLDRRVQGRDSSSDGRWELFHRQREEWEPVGEVPSSRHILLDTGGGVRDTMAGLLRRLYAGVL